MPRFILILLFCALYFSCAGQFLARMELKEPISGLCDSRNVYVMFPSFKGQTEAVCPVAEEVIAKRLNAEIQFLRDNPGYDDKGMIGLVINCKGEVVQCRMDNKTSSPELDKQIEAVFNSLGEWMPGKLKRKSVDTSRLFSFEIKDGEFSLN